MNKKHLLIGILVIIAASFLLAVQVDFSTNKKEQINMYVFQDVTVDSGISFKEVSLEANELMVKDISYLSNNFLSLTF